MSKQIEWTTTEQPEPVTRAWRLRVFRTDGDNWAGRDATEADLLAAGYVPASDLRAARERYEQLERELGEAKRDGAFQSIRRCEVDALQESLRAMTDKADESSTRLAACEKVVRAARLVDSTWVTYPYTFACKELREALSKLDAAHPALPEADITPELLEAIAADDTAWPKANGEERACHCGSPSPFLHDRACPMHEPTERAEDDHLAKAREALERHPFENDLTRAIGHLLAHLEQQRAPAPSEAAAVKPSEASPLPWKVRNNLYVLASVGRLVTVVDRAEDAAFIVALANRWHAVQGGAKRTLDPYEQAGADEPSGGFYGTLGTGQSPAGEGEKS